MRVARGIVVASTIVAALTETYLATQYHPATLWISVIGFVALLVIGAQWRRVALPLLAAAMYLVLAMYIAADPARQAGFGLDIVWVLPLLGLALSNGLLEWSLPAAVRTPLVMWALVVAVSWPLVFLRETDFALWVLPLPRVSNASTGFSPWDVDLNVAYFVLLANVGILFFDALCRWFAADRDRFTNEVLKPMAAAAGVAALVAFYQGFIDLAFLNQRFWEYMIRAAGTLGDPNKLGAVAAFWTVGSMVLVRRMSQRAAPFVALAAIFAGGGAVWLSGSRTGLASVTISVTIAAFEAARNWWRDRRGAALDIKKIAMYGGGGLVVAAAMIVVLQSASTHTIVARGTLGYLPFFGDRGIAASANELLWERYGYGPAAMDMIKDHPIDGVGVGTFHMLVTDYGRPHHRGLQLATDNAQAWWRHQLAELGIVGVIPIVWWCVAFAGIVLSRTTSGDRLSIGMLRGVLVGFFVASLFGMPAQSIAIVMTFWVFAFWFLLEKGQTERTPSTPASDKRWLIAAAVLVLVHTGATAVDAFGTLRPLERAKRWDWYYRYGWVFIQDELEPDPGGNPVGRRWTMKKSVSLVEVKGRVLKFVAWVEHPDADQKPVHARVWADSVMVYEGNLKRGQSITLDLPAKPREKYLVIETEIDRLFRPSDFNPVSRDRRELGLSVRDWVWE